MSVSLERREVRAEQMLPWQLREAMATRPVVYVPLGTIEWHCEHLPVGLDALTAHGVCLAAAKTIGGMVLPPLYYGTGGRHGGYPWTIMMDSEAEIAAQVSKTLERLEAFDCRLAILFSGHFADAQLAMIDRLAAEWNAQRRPLQVLATAVNRMDVANFPPDHAGVFETTLLYALHPYLVQLDRLPSVTDAPLADDDVWEDGRHDPKHPIWGVVGPDPRTFQPSAAPWLLEACVNRLSHQVQAHMRKIGGKGGEQSTRG